MLESRKFNSDTLHQDLICYAAKNKHISLKRDFISLIFYLKQILKLLFFINILFTKEINYLWKNIYFYIFILYLISGVAKKSR